MFATAPGKLMLTGEYAVLDGAPSVVIAIDRRVRARIGDAPASSPFLLAVARAIAERRGDSDPAARAALSVVVDSSAFYAGTQKLGFGSSAAVTVAATAVALTATAMTDAAAIELIDRAEILAIAHAAHLAAQAGRGSGADIAAAVHGGALVFRPTGETSKRTWPHSVRIIPFFTGASASTTQLVAQVHAARDRDPTTVGAALAAIGDASLATSRALGAPPEIAAIGILGGLALAAAAFDRLAQVTGVPLVPPCVVAARAAMARFGGTAKTTGAGGGDIAVAAVPATADVTSVHAALIQAGCEPLAVTVDETGVDLQGSAQ